MADRIRILIVEDQQLLRETLEKALEMEKKFSVIGSCSCGDAAMQFMEEQSHFREKMTRSLESELGFSVVGSCDGSDRALQFMENCETDIVLLDRLMPGMNGLTLTRKLKQKYPAVKVIMLSMISDEARVKEAIEAGVDGYLPKEISIPTLIDTIKQVMAGHRTLCYMITNDLVKLYT